MRRFAAWQPSQPSWWVVIALLLGCAPVQVASLSMHRGDPTVIVVVAQLAAVQLAICVSAVALLGLGRPRGNILAQTPGLAWLALGWGCIVVPVVAADANTRYFEALHSLGLRSIAASIAAPIDEDLLRLAGTLGVLVLAATRRPVTVLDGLGFGFLVGAGFEIAENVAYVLAVHGSGESTTVEAIVQTAFVRTGLGFALHALWTGITGAALAHWLERSPANSSRRFWLLALAVIVPLMLHALWDAPALSIRPEAKLVVLVLVYATSIILFLVVALRARRITASVSSATEQCGRAMPE